MAEQEHSVEEMLKCAKRELGMREHVYPRWVDQGKMTSDKMKREISLMKGIVAFLETHVPPPAQGSLLP
jgi:hypothetical protein